MSLVLLAAGGRGLPAGLDELNMPAQSYCEKLKKLGLLSKETHEFVIRIAPPLVTGKDDLEWAVGRILLAIGH